MTSSAFSRAARSGGVNSEMADRTARPLGRWLRLGVLGAGLLHCAAFAGLNPPGLPGLNPPTGPLGEVAVAVIGDQFGDTGYGNVETVSGSVPPGLEINCGGVGQRNCSTHYLPQTRVRLTVKPSGVAEFVGWGGDCEYARNAATCQVTVVAGRVHRVLAEFRAARVGVRMLGPVGQRVRLSWPRLSASPSWQKDCVRTDQNPRCEFLLPPSADRFDVLPQPVEGRWPAVSCAGAATCDTTTGNRVTVEMHPTAVDRNGDITVDAGLAGALLLQKVRGTDCSLPEAATELRVEDANGRLLQRVLATAVASLVPVPTPPSQVVVKVAAGPGRLARWLGCRNTAGLTGAMPQIPECSVAINGLQTVVTACFP